jgi:hypothetical protein
VDRTPAKRGEIWDRTSLPQSPCFDRFAGKRRANRSNLRLLAMQKVEGSSPFSRLEVPAKSTVG